MPRDPRAGFPRPAPLHQMARQRTAMALIATVALAISTMIAATVVSIGIARASGLAAVGSGDSQLSTLALFLGIVLAFLGGLVVWSALRGAAGRFEG